MIEGSRISQGKSVSDRNRRRRSKVRRLEALELRITPATLVAAYGFDEGAGVSVADASGTGNTGTLASATWSTSGKFGGALSFNGTSARVNIPDSPSVRLSSGMTLEAWVRPTVVSNAWRDVIFKGDDNYYLMATTTNSSRPLAGMIAGGSYAEAQGTSVLATNSWTHLAGTYDGANLRLYLNGTQVSSVAKTGLILNSSNPLQIGGDSIYGQYFSGLIDEVRIYDGALSQAQIQADMNTAINTGTDTTAPTVSAVSPTSGGTGVGAASNVTVTFSEAMDATTINASTLELRDESAVLVPAAISYDAATRTATLDPNASLALGATYTLTVRGGAADPRVKDLAGNAALANFTSTFTTALPTLGVSDPSVVEGDSGSVTMTFVVTLSGASGKTVSVTYATVNGTATAGVDYAAVGPANLTFNPGQTAQSVAVTVFGDTASESTETVLFNLSNPTNATIADGQGVGSIVSDDVAFIAADSFGYIATSWPVEAIDLVPGAVNVTTIRSTGDNNSNSVTLAGGATFNFYGVSYTTLNVSTNGLIAFDTSITTATNTNLTSSPTQRVIAPLWDDWTNTSGNAMLLQKYEDLNGDGLSDRLILEWNNVQGAPSSPSPVTFQAILQLNTGTNPGAITFNYIDTDTANAIANGASATVGIKDSGTQGTRRILVSFNATSTFVGSGKAIRVGPDVIPPTVALTSPASGSLVSGMATVNATAADNLSVASVQFQLDGANLGAADTTAPYSITWNTLSAAPGPHVMTAVARDSRGNAQTSAPINVTVADQAAPTVSLTAPANNSTVTGAVTIAATAIDNVAVAGVQFFLDGGSLAPEDSSAPYSIVWDSSVVSAGTHQLTAVARDTSNNQTTSAVVFVTVTVPDVTPPTVSITAPSGGAYIAGNTTITAVASDNVAVAGVQFQIDGVNFGLEDTTAPYSVAWNSFTASRGAHSISAIARDTSGNLVPSATVTVTVVPKLTITLPAQGATLISSTVGVSYTTQGDMSGVTAVQFVLDGVTSSDVTIDGSYQLTNVGNGPHVLTGYVVQDAQTESGATPVSFTVALPETVPPTATITAPVNNAVVSGAVQVTAAATDNVGVAGVQFFLDGVSLGPEDTTAPYSVTWNSQTAAAGTHTLIARARDTSGNFGDSPAITVTVANPNDPSVVGSWSSVMDWPLVAINMVLMKNGKVLMWDGGWNLCIGSSSAQVWDPATNIFTPVPVPDPNHQTDLFCSGMVAMADGRVLVVGGHECNNPTYLGQANTYLFDPDTMQWTRPPDTYYRRWYPTVTALPDGRAITIAGSQYSFNDYNSIPEIYDPQTNTWTRLTGANQVIPNYAFAFVLPDGRLLAAGSDEALMGTYALDIATQTWTVVDPRILDAGSAVMYLPGKVMKAGASYVAGDQSPYFGVPSKPTTYVLDMTQPTPAWQQTSSMANPRTHLNLTVLPDGNVLATGGSTDLSGERDAYAVLPAEMWSPVTQSWTTMASMQFPRMYHSTALLLPDGRVLTAGGGRDYPYTTDYLNAQYYSPPYLSKGPRPTISAVPSVVNYQSSFFVQSPDAASISSISLIRNGSITHAFNMDQRLVPLTFTQGVGGLNVQAPANANLAPPGSYMLFIVNSNGVPSIAPIVHLPSPSEDTQPPTAPASLSAVGAIGTASLSWPAASDNFGVVSYNVYRSTSAGFTPAIGNRIAQVASTNFTDTGLAAGTYYYRVAAVDSANNTGPASPQASAAVTADTALPTVSLTSPLGGSTVSGTINITASASDDVAVAGVQFLIDGANLGSEDTSAPYSASWNSALLANGNHVITAQARDTGGNLATSTPVNVTVSNQAPSGLVLALGMNAGAGSSVADESGYGNSGTVGSAAWVTGGKYGGALFFDGAGARVDITDSASLHLSSTMTLEAWVNPSVTSSAWRDIIYKGDDIYFLMATSGSGGVPAAEARVVSSNLEAYGPTILPRNAWSHLATTFDGTNLRLYVDGNLVATAVRSGTILSSNNPLQIGGDSIYGQYFTGLIDEVRVYNRALSQVEIQADMANPITAATPDTIAPSAPATLAATAVSGTQVDLSWAAATDNVGVASYRVQRQDPGGSYVQMVQVTGTTFSDAPLTAGTTYNYRVYAVDAAGNAGPFSPVAAVTTLASDTIPPSAPGSLSVTAISSTQINLSWAAATDNVGVVGYRLERKNPGSSSFVQIAAPTGTTFNDTGLTANSAYDYRVRAADAAGNLGAYSAVVTGATPAAPANPAGLVAAYSFNEGSGATINDQSSLANNGVASNASWGTGKYGGALSFNGSNTRVNIADSASLRLTSGMTLEAWVNPTVISNAWRDVVYKGDDNYYLMATSTNSSRPLGGVIAGGSYAEAIGTTALTANTWTHLATTYDGATLRFYINGTQVSSQARTGNILTSSNPLQIGGDSIYGQYFAGLIDEVRVYNRALSAAEIQTDMNTPLGAALALAAPPADGATGSALSTDDLLPLVNQAKALWQSALGAGVGYRQLSIVQVQIVDLPGQLLGLASGSQIFLDRDAAGYGWFTDPSPWDDAELSGAASPAAGRADLLSVIAHEMGHILGLEHDQGMAAPNSVMANSLALGERHLDFSGLSLQASKWDALWSFLADEVSPFSPTTKKRR